MTPDVNDFIGPFVYQNLGKIQTTSDLQIKMIAFGMIQWNMVSQDGTSVRLRSLNFLFLAPMFAFLLLSIMPNIIASTAEN